FQFVLLENNKCVCSFLIVCGLKIILKIFEFLSMKKDKKCKSYSFRREKTRRRTSSDTSSETTCCMILNSNKQHSRRSSTVSCISTASSSRSLPRRKKATQSDFLSSIDLCSKEKSKSIAFYIDNREEMVHHMFASLHRRELYELLPENLKNLEIAELRYLCIKELNEMSTKNIRTILRGKDFAGSSESEGEKDAAQMIKSNIKTSKTEIAVADSTTEMTAPNSINLPGIFHADNTDNAFVWSNIINIPEVHYAPVEDNSLFKNQENHSVVHSSFDMEQRIPLSSNQHAKIFASDDVSNPKNEVVANIMTENDDELEDGEVLSDEETSSDSNKKAALRKYSNQFLDVLCRYIAGERFILIDYFF
ncbi:hypothetical protein X798_01778, partial [Onchocerca flexuosa]